MSFPVSLKKNGELCRAMERLGIREADLEETFIQSGGPGGQNVNKVATCVVLKHAPSGMVVRCQKERSQAMNRYHARRLLIEKLDARIRGRESEAARKIHKIRKQKRRRSRKAKEKMLQAKKQKSHTKELRRRVKPE